MEAEVEKVIENIRKYGVFEGDGEGRKEVIFDKLGCPADQKSEYVLLSGCVIPERIPQFLNAIKEFMEEVGVSYTFLSKEYCCGWLPLLQPAVIAKDSEKVNLLKKVSQEFIEANIKQAENLGAKAIVTLCSACEPNYRNFKQATKIEIIHYIDLLARYFGGGKLELEADYYPGCYRFRRRITDVPFDFQTPLSLLNKIEGLKLNPVNETLCCYIPPHFDEILKSVSSRVVITTCTGCYSKLKQELPKEKHDIKLLPEIITEALKAQKLGA